jgi:hypothetical protein
MLSKSSTYQFFFARTLFPPYKNIIIAITFNRAMCSTLSEQHIKEFDRAMCSTLSEQHIKEFGEARNQRSDDEIENWLREKRF